MVTEKTPPDDAMRRNVRFARAIAVAPPIYFALFSARAYTVPPRSSSKGRLFEGLLRKQGSQKKNRLTFKKGFGGNPGSGRSNTHVSPSGECVQLAASVMCEGEV